MHRKLVEIGVRPSAVKNHAAGSFINAVNEHPVRLAVSIDQLRKSANNSSMEFFNGIKVLKWSKYA